MIRMSETTRTHTPGKQLDCDILISSLMKHVLTNRPMFHSDSEELRTKIWATKSTYSDQTRNFEKESSIWSVIWYVQLSLARFGIHVIGSIPKQYKLFWTPRVRLKLIMRWCVQNLSTVNDGTNYRPVSMISNLTETLMCLIEETGDSTHKRTGRGSWEAFNPSPLRLPNFK